MAQPMIRLDSTSCSLSRILSILPILSKLRVSTHYGPDRDKQATG